MTATLRPTLALVLALAVCGCGSTSETPVAASPGAVPTDRERPRLRADKLVRRANAVCARRVRALAALPEPGPGVELADVMANVLTIERRESLGLLALRPPRAQETAYARLVAASVELVRVTGRLRDSLRDDGNGPRQAALADAERVSEAYDRAAAELGLACRQTRAESA